MAVVYVEELFAGRAGSDGIERNRTYVRTFEVRTDDPNDDAFTAGAGTGIPRNGEEHPSDEFATMTRINAYQSDADNTLWQVTCEYQSEPAEDQQREALTYDSSGNPETTPEGDVGGGGGSFVRDDDPTARSAQWSNTTETVMEIAEEEAGFFGGIFGDAILNSAGDPFDPPVMVERQYGVITITKNVPLNSPILQLSKLAEFRNTINDADYLGHDAGTLRVAQLDTASAIENRTAYAVVTLQVKIRPEGWVRRVIDRGFNMLSTYDPNGDAMLVTEKTRIKDRHGEPLGEPSLLDGSGGVLPEGLDPHFLEFDVYNDSDFAELFGYLGF
jgi:hypothetical protein